MKRFLPIACILILVVALSGCGGSGSTAIDDLIEQAQTNPQEMQSYRMDMNMEFSASGDDSDDGSVSMEMAMNSESGDMSMVMEMSVPESSESQLVQMYVVDNVLYAGIPNTDTGDTSWIKIRVDLIGAANQFASGQTGQEIPDPSSLAMDESFIDILGVLQSTCDLTIEGTQIVKGVECYKVTVVPNMAQFIEKMMILMDDSDMDFTEYSESMGVTLPTDLIDNGADIDHKYDAFAEEMASYMGDLSASVYLAVETGMLVKVEGTMSIEAEGQTGEMSFDMTIYDVNEEITVELPEAAQGDDVLDLTAMLDFGS
ncbi:MAG: DUF6612 family protein [Chloroflexota bacterium]|nr:DUF6612 family protein [Chloroflexota bacterium]